MVAPFIVAELYTKYLLGVTDAYVPEGHVALSSLEVKNRPPFRNQKRKVGHPHVLHRGMLQSQCPLMVH